MTGRSPAAGSARICYAASRWCASTAAAARRVETFALARVLAAALGRDRHARVLGPDAVAALPASLARRVRELQNVMAALAISAPRLGRITARLVHPVPHQPSMCETTPVPLVAARSTCRRSGHTALASCGTTTLAARELGLRQRIGERSSSVSMTTRDGRVLERRCFRNHPCRVRLRAPAVALTVPVLLSVATLVFALIHLVQRSGRGDAGRAARPVTWRSFAHGSVSTGQCSSKSAVPAASCARSGRPLLQHAVTREITQQLGPTNSLHRPR